MSNFSNSSARQFFRELNLELNRRAMWGSRGRRLRQDLEDHLASTRDELVEAGETVEAAELHAVQRLGMPGNLAENCRLQAVQSSFIARHPGLAGFLPSLLLFGLIPLAVVAAGFWSSGLWAEQIAMDPSAGPVNIETLFYMREAFNNGVWWMALLFIAVLSWRSSLGWRFLLLATAGIAISANLYTMQVQLPRQGPGSGSLTFHQHPLVQAISYSFSRCWQGTAQAQGFLGRPSWGTAMDWLRPLLLLAVPWAVLLVRGGWQFPWARRPALASIVLALAVTAPAFAAENPPAKTTEDHSPAYQEPDTVGAVVFVFAGTNHPAEADLRAQLQLKVGAKATFASVNHDMHLLAALPQVGHVRLFGHYRKDGTAWFKFLIEGRDPQETKQSPTLPPNLDGEEDRDAIVAMVDGSAVTEMDVTDATHLAAMDLKKIYGDHPDLLKQKYDEMRAHTLDDLIERQLLVGEFQRRGEVIPQGYYDEAVKSMVASTFSGNQETFNKWIAACGYSLSDYEQAQMRDKEIGRIMRSQLDQEAAPGTKLAALRANAKVWIYEGTERLHDPGDLEDRAPVGPTMGSSMRTVTPNDVIGKVTIQYVGAAHPAEWILRENLWLKEGNHFTVYAVNSDMHMLAAMRTVGNAHIFASWQKDGRLGLRILIESRDLHDTKQPANLPANLARPDEMDVVGFAAIVDGYAVTDIDVTRETQWSGPKIEAAYAAQPEVLGQKLQEDEKRVVQMLVERMLLVREFRKRGGVVPESYLQDWTARIIATTYEGSQARFYSSLKNLGYSMSDYEQEELRQWAEDSWMRDQLNKEGQPSARLAELRAKATIWDFTSGG
jgi:hypothetical protein